MRPLTLDGYPLHSEFVPVADDPTNCRYIGEYYVQIIEERGGVILDRDGVLRPTHDGYAGIGRELDEHNQLTGRIVVWAGNTKIGKIDTIRHTDLDHWLLTQPNGWPTYYRDQNLIIEI